MAGRFAGHVKCWECHGDGQTTSGKMCALCDGHGELSVLDVDMDAYRHWRQSEIEAEAYLVESQRFGTSSVVPADKISDEHVSELRRHENWTVTQHQRTDDAEQ